MEMKNATCSIRFFNNGCIFVKKNSNNNDTIFYNFIGNIIPQNGER
ncbi:hypothetical protein [Orientia tsutsugamushi]|nr:hypothetical protein [Orientia tsutsugamushi]